MHTPSSESEESELEDGGAFFFLDFFLFDVLDAFLAAGAFSVSSCGGVSASALRPVFSFFRLSSSGTTGNADFPGSTFTTSLSGLGL
jgi:hypothetical protein